MLLDGSDQSNVFDQLQTAQATVDPPQKYETIASAIREPQDDHDAPAPAR